MMCKTLSLHCLILGMSMVSNLGLGMGNQLREGQLINNNEKMGLKGMKEDEHG